MTHVNAKAPTGMQVLPHLTSWRFFAAAFVIFHHFWLIPDRAAANRSEFHPLYAALDAGFVSVSFFFVLSGFILCYTTLARQDGNKLDKRKYFLNRFARIYPLYLLTLLPEALAAMRGALARGGPPDAAGFFITKTLMIQGWFPQYTQGWNDPTWSLSVEALFYVLFPVLIVGAARIRRNHLLPATLVMLIFGVAVQWWLRNDFPAPDDMRFFARHPILRVPEFLVGILLGRVYLESLLNGEAVRRATPIVVALCVLAVCGYRQLGVPANALALVPLAALVMCASYGQGGILAHPKLVLLGEASYGLYLLHEPLHIWMVRLSRKFAFDLGTPLGFALVLTTCVLTSVFLHLKFEVPVRNFIRGLGAKRGASTS